MLLRHRFYSIKVYVFSFVAPFIVNVIDWNWFLYIYNAHYTHHLCGGFFCVKISCLFFQKKNIVFNWERKRMVNLFQKPTIVQFNQIINIIVYERVCFFLFSSWFRLFSMLTFPICHNTSNQIGIILTLVWYNLIFLFLSPKMIRKNTHTHTPNETHPCQFIINDFEQEWRNLLLNHRNVL